LPRLHSSQTFPNSTWLTSPFLGTQNMLVPPFFFRSSRFFLCKLTSETYPMHYIFFSPHVQPLVWTPLAWIGCLTFKKEPPPEQLLLVTQPSLFQFPNPTFHICREVPSLFSVLVAFASLNFFLSPRSYAGFLPSPAFAFISSPAAPSSAMPFCLFSSDLRDYIATSIRGSPLPFF